MKSRDQKLHALKLKPKTTDTNQDGEEHECLNWLKSQTSRSVVFLCFGSLGSFPEKQLKEIAVGLENSDQRFLWAVRNPPPDNDKDPNFSFRRLSKLPHYFFYRSVNTSKPLPSRSRKGDERIKSMSIKGCNFTLIDWRFGVDRIPLHSL